MATSPIAIFKKVQCCLSNFSKGSDALSNLGVTGPVVVHPPTPTPPPAPSPPPPPSYTLPRYQPTNTARALYGGPNYGFGIQISNTLRQSYLDVTGFSLCDDKGFTSNCGIVIGYVFNTFPAKTTYPFSK